MIALIMAGGAGTRFWPLSRNKHPKQFLKVAGQRSMLQLTVDRLLPVMPITDVYIVTAASQVPLVQEHLPNLPLKNIIIEPFGMNTAPCIALSVEYLKAIYPPETTMIVLPADHVIKDTAAFTNSLKQADAAAQKDRLITFGIVPDYPATGYGYIEAGAEIEGGIKEVTRFKEKPDRKTAEGFLASGSFFWNSGMFCWSLGTIDKAFKAHLPQAAMLCEKIGLLWKEKGVTADITEIYKDMPKTPIDIGIMEPATNRAVIPVDLGWNDVGSWKAMAEINPVDVNGNYSTATLFSIDSQHNYINTSKFTAIIGVENLCVVETEDALLITARERSEDVKLVVEYLKKNKDELL